MFAVVLLPDFELQCALRAAPELAAVPVALIGEVDGFGVPIIQQVNAAAESEGVHSGLTLPQAQARCPGLAFLRIDLPQQEIATAALLQAAERASPYLELTRPGCCTLDLRRHGELDHALWADDLITGLQLLHLRAQVGIAPTPDAALQAAQLARPVLITSDPRQSLGSLPVVVLGPSGRLLDVLSDWGIHRVADLRALDRQQVAERLGAEGLKLWDQAAGGSIRPLRLVRAEATYVEAAEFDGGVETLEPILFRLRRCLEQLAHRLRADLLLAGAIELVLELDDRGSLARTIHLPAPTCEVDVLFRVLCTYLDTVTTTARVNGFRLQAFPSTPRDHQAHLWEASLRDPNGFSETLARISGIVGANQVGTPVRLPTHRPDSFRLEAPRFEAKDAVRKTRGKPKPDDGPPAFLPLGLSLRRYRPPFRINVQSERNAPRWLSGGREVEGGIRASAGPWRLDGLWWEEKAAWVWEEWDIELAAGGLYRLAQHRQVNWWMLGVYD